jgi:hypothetical protein
VSFCLPLITNTQEGPFVCYLPSGIYTAGSFIPAPPSSPYLIIPIIHPHQAIGITTAYASDYFILPYPYLHLFYSLKPASSHDSDSFAFAAVLAIDFLHCFVLPIASPHSSVLRSLSSHGLITFTVYCANALLLRASRFSPFVDYRFHPLAKGPGHTLTLNPLLATTLTLVRFASSSFLIRRSRTADPSSAPHFDPPFFQARGSWFPSQFRDSRSWLNCDLSHSFFQETTSWHPYPS